MKIKILTIFPEMFQGPFQSSILKRAQENGLLTVELVDIRAYSQDRHQKVDDYPFGGGAGMVMKPEPFYDCLEAVDPGRLGRRILLSPQGRVFNQKRARELAREREIILICGHYEGIDERVKTLVDEEISLGDFILTGGEIAAMALVDSVTRLIPGVVGGAGSLVEETFNDGLLEYPHYTRPASYRQMEVPQVLLSGNHQEVDRWRRRQSVRRTFFRRPDLLVEAEWSDTDRATIDAIFLNDVS